MPYSACISELSHTLCCRTFVSWESYWHQRQFFFATETLAEKHLLDELCDRGVSDSNDQCVDRDEGVHFSSRVSALITSHLV